MDGCKTMAHHPPLIALPTSNHHRPSPLSFFLHHCHHHYHLCHSLVSNLPRSHSYHFSLVILTSSTTFLFSFSVTLSFLLSSFFSYWLGYKKHFTKVVYLKVSIMDVFLGYLMLYCKHHPHCTFPVTHHHLSSAPIPTPHFFLLLHLSSTFCYLFSPFLFSLLPCYHPLLFSLSLSHHFFSLSFLLFSSLFSLSLPISPSLKCYWATRKLFVNSLINY